jgi:hypothetical protein
MKSNLVNGVTAMVAQDWRSGGPQVIKTENPRPPAK